MNFKIGDRVRFTDKALKDWASNDYGYSEHDVFVILSFKGYDSNPAARITGRNNHYVYLDNIQKCIVSNYKGNTSGTNI